MALFPANRPHASSPLIPCAKCGALLPFGLTVPVRFGAGAVGFGHSDGGCDPSYEVLWQTKHINAAKSEARMIGRIGRRPD